MSSADNVTLKQREEAGWTEVAAGWRKYDTRLRESFAPVTERMLALAQVGAGGRVLDIASGTGEPAIPAAEQVGPSGFVLATDLADDMLAAAREKAARRQLRNVEFRRADGEELDVAAGSFDAVLIRWGLMFMPDPVACLQRAHRALKPGGRIAVACWGGPEANPWVALPLRPLQRRLGLAPPPGIPGLFALADPERLHGLLAAARFREVGLEQVHLVPGGEFEDGRSLFEFVRDLSSPMARLYAQLSPEARAAADDEVAEEVERRRTGAKVSLQGMSWVAHGRK